jgi:hypothetical protein
MQRQFIRTNDPAVLKAVENQGRMHQENIDRMARISNPPHPLWEVLPDGAWKGEPAFIIGGGPSLERFDFERLRGRGRVIAINRAYEFISWADLLFFMDFQFWQFEQSPERLPIWQAFQAPKAFLNIMGREVPDCYNIRAVDRSGVSLSHKKGLYHGNNSGYGALQLALALGCRPIYLLGYDMLDVRKGRGDPRRTHWHDGYGKYSGLGVPLSFRRDFEQAAQSLKRFEIYNLNPMSGLRTFKFKTIEEVLGDGTGQNMGHD